MLKEDKNNMFVEEVVVGLPKEEIVNMCTGCPQYICCESHYNRKCSTLFSIIASIILNKDGAEQNKKDGEGAVVNRLYSMQKDVMVGLLNARRECIGDNVLTARGMVAVIDALFYLVRYRPIPAFIKGDIKDNDNKTRAICMITGNYCSYCTLGPCEHRKEVDKIEKDK